MENTSVDKKNNELKVKAHEIGLLSVQNPGVAFSVDPELAEYMGVFDNDSLTPEDIEADREARTKFPLEHECLS